MNYFSPSFYLSYLSLSFQTRKLSKNGSAQKWHFCLSWPLTSKRLVVGKIWEHVSERAFQEHSFFNLRPAGGGGCLNTPPCAYSRIARKRRRAAPPGFDLPYPPIFLATFVKVSILGHARSGHQVRSSDHTLQKILQSRPSHSVWGKVMKLSEYDKVIGTYKMYIFDFWYRWPFSWPPRYKSMGKN